MIPKHIIEISERKRMAADSNHERDFVTLLRRGDIRIAVEITLATHFSKFMQYIAETHPSGIGTFVFTAEGFAYNLSNTQGTIFNSASFNRPQMTTYIYECGMAQYAFGFNIDSFRDSLKAIRKKDGLRIFLVKGSQDFFGEILLSGKTKGGVFRIGAVDGGVPALLELEGFYSRIDDPNCTVPGAEINSAASSIKKMKCPTTTITSSHRGIRWQAPTKSQGNDFQKDYGTYESGTVSAAAPAIAPLTTLSLLETATTISFTPPAASAAAGSPAVFVPSFLANISPAPLPTVPTIGLAPLSPIPTSAYKITVDLRTVHALRHLSGITDGNVEMYMESGLPLKMRLPIGTYGNLIIHIRNAQK